MILQVRDGHVAILAQKSVVFGLHPIATNLVGCGKTEHKGAVRIFWIEAPRQAFHAQRAGFPALDLGGGGLAGVEFEHGHAAAMVAQAFFQLNGRHLQPRREALRQRNNRGFSDRTDG